MTDTVDPLTDAVAAELRAQRARREATYSQMVASTGLSEASIKRYLKGTREIPMSAFLKLCAALSVDPRVIFDKAQEAVK